MSTILDWSIIDRNVPRPKWHSTELCHRQTWQHKVTFDRTNTACIKCASDHRWTRNLPLSVTLDAPPEICNTTVVYINDVVYQECHPCSKLSNDDDDANDDSTHMVSANIDYISIHRYRKLPELEKHVYPFLWTENNAEWCKKYMAIGMTKPIAIEEHRYKIKSGKRIKLIE